MEHLSNDHKDWPSQHDSGHKLSDEMGHTIMNLMGSQWKLRKQHGQNFPMEGKPCRTNTSEEINKCKRAVL